MRREQLAAKERNEDEKLTREAWGREREREVEMHNVS
jgi:hypothetical protein